jgi:hypothetical protein
MALKKPYQECTNSEECTVNRSSVDPKADRELRGSNLPPKAREVFESWPKERHRAALGATGLRQKGLEEIRGALLAMRKISRSKGPNDGRYSDWFG